MPHRFQISQDSQALYITVVTRNRLLVFKTDQMKAVLCRAVDEARTSAGFLLFAYVIMIDHMHLVTSRPTTTSNVLRVLKGLTARRVIDFKRELITFIRIRCVRDWWTAQRTIDGPVPASGKVAHWKTSHCWLIKS
jgi:REP element-mobilizing transposase RayT